MIEDKSAATKARLLAAGRRIFGLHGVQGATTRMICAEAKANLAAVSYHFGGKDQLLAAVVRDHLREAEQRFPLDAGITPDSPAEKRLRAFVRGMLARLLGDGDEEYDRIGKLIAAEMLDPPPYFWEIMDAHMQPWHEKLRVLVREMLPGVEEASVSRCVASIEGQCVLFRSAKSALWRMCPEVSPELHGLEPAADFIVEFSLGGMARLRGCAA